jgi:hypothetical protein
MPNIIKPRRDTAANWASVNPTLAAGEIGYDSTNKQFKIGTGSTAWTSLPFSTESPDGAQAKADTAESDAISSAASDATTKVSTHAGLSTTHGVSGSIVGTSDTQTLTNKTIDGNSNTLTVLNAQTTATASANNNTIVLRDGSANTAVNQITLGVDPTQDMHAATKAYVDALASGVNWHVAVKAAQASNISNGTYTAGSAGGDGGTGVGAYIESNTNGAIGTVDGYQMLLNDRLLYIGATNQVHNGIYVVSNAGSAGTPWRITRAANFDGGVPADYVHSGDAVYILNGTNYGNQGYIQVNIGTGVGEIIKVGTDSMSWQQFTGAASIIAGTALSKSGNTLSVVEATQSVPGYLSASDKTKLDGLRMPISFHIAGTLTTGVKAPRFISPVACTLSTARAFANAGSDVTYRIVLNSSTNSNTSASVGQAVVATSLTGVTSLAVGDVLQVEIVSAGTSGADLSVTVEAAY